ncbi:MAG: 16S rRNA (adenine(1518)-N(6)/adenine(1519)-N(6))-dimethyltransferase RsmA [Acidimicrobiales bacterium]
MTLTIGELKRVLYENEVRPRRSLGQNFVVDPNTVRRIVRLAGIREGDLVVEVGAGLGSLTLALCEAGARVKAVEIDRRLIPQLRRALEGTSAEVIQADALGVDWDELIGEDETSGGSAPFEAVDLEGSSRRECEDHGVVPSYRLVANLPYNIATSVVIDVLERARRIDSMLIMVQREVGERMVARPRSKAYGSVSVKIAYWAEASLIGKVPSTVFYPRPNVESVLVKIERRGRRGEVPMSSRDDRYGRFCEVVEAGFGQRRKTLRSSLKGVVEPDSFDRVAISPGARAEELSVDDWKRLCELPR